MKGNKLYLAALLALILALTTNSAWARGGGNGKGGRGMFKIMSFELDILCRKVIFSFRPFGAECTLLLFRGFTPPANQQ